MGFLMENIINKDYQMCELQIAFKTIYLQQMQCQCASLTKPTGTLQAIKIVSIYAKIVVKLFCYFNVVCF